MSVTDVPAPGQDDSLTCLAELAASSEELLRRVSQLSQLGPFDLAGTWPPARTVPLEKRLMLIEQISAVVRDLVREGSRFRRLQAHALYAEGLTMAELAAVFGVSRQRVGALLRDGPDDPGDHLDFRPEVGPGGASVDGWPSGGGGAGPDAARPGGGARP